MDGTWSKAYLFAKPWDISQPFDERIVGHVGEIEIHDGMISVEKYNPFVSFEKNTTITNAMKAFNHNLDRPLTWTPQNVYQQIGKYITDRRDRLAHARRYEAGELTAREMYMIGDKSKFIYGIRTNSHMPTRVIQHLDRAYSTMDDMSDQRSWPPAMHELERVRAAHLWSTITRVHKLSNFILYDTLDACDNWKRLILVDETVRSDGHDEESIERCYQYVRAQIMGNLLECGH